MSRRTAFEVACLFLILIPAVSAPTPVTAANRFWINPAGGDFDSSSDWSATPPPGTPGASTPGAADIANFTLNNTYDIFSSFHFTTSELDVENGNVTFDFDAKTYTLTSVFAVEVGNISGQTGRLTITDGTIGVDTAGDDIRVGDISNSTGFLTAGAGGDLGSPATRPDFVVARFGTGTLTVQNDGRVFGGTFTVGDEIGSTGTVTATGPQASISVSGTLTIGDMGGATMTVSNGADVSAGTETTLGNFGGSTGTLTITGAGSTWTQSTPMTVGDGGVGTLNVQSGGSLTTGSTIVGFGSESFGTATISGGGSVSTQAITIGDSSSSTTGLASGSLTVTGSGSSLTTNGQGFIVGDEGDGEVTVTAGGSITTGQTTLGNLVGSGGSSSGTLSVSGSTSLFTSSSGTFTVGAAGAGDMEVTGGTVNSLVSQIAASAGSTGSATISGTSSVWNTTTLAIGGVINTNGGAGTLTIESGGTVNVSGETQIRNSAGSSLTIDGGTLVVGGTFTRLGTLKHNDGTLHVKGSYNNGSAPAALVIDGATSGDLATLRLSGNSAVQNVNLITVGSVNQGALVVDSGRTVNVGANNVSIGAGPLSTGTVTLSGANSSLTTTGTLSVGGTGETTGGTGTLTVGTGATVGSTSATLNLFAGGVVNLNGGTLRAGTFNANGGNVNFTSGTFSLSGAQALDASKLDALLGTGHTVGTGKTLSIPGTLTLSSALNVNGGTLIASGLINSGSLHIADGLVQVLTFSLTNDVGRLLQISGTGRLSAAITNNGTIQLNDNLIPTGGGSLTNNGVVRGIGLMTNSLNNTASGQVQLTAGNRLEFIIGGQNAGLISLNGGEIQFNAVLINDAGTGLISGHDAILRANGGITNNGSIAFTAGTMDVFGDIASTRFVSASDRSRITVSGGGIATFYDDVTVSAGQTDIQVSAAAGVVSRVVFFGSYNGGTTGGGTAFIEGDHRPGNSPALVNFGGDVFFGPSSQLSIEIAGLSQGSDYDAVTSAGAISLTGGLDVSLLDGFTPTPGNSFQIITAAGGVAGTFSNVLLPTLSNSSWHLRYNPNSVVLQVGLSGDYNLNGTVDAADYVIWRKTLGQMGSGLAADGNGNNQIDTNDYDVWRAHFGQTAGSGALANSSIPEPASFGMLLIGILVTFFADSQPCHKLIRR